jgi:hypothetical protein
MVSPPPALPVNPALEKQSHLGLILGVETVFMFLAVTITILRLYTRATVVKIVGSDDWTIAGAAVRVLSFSCFSCFIGYAAAEEALVGARRIQLQPTIVFGNHRANAKYLQLCSLGGWIVFAYQAYYGLGRHIGFISPEDQVKLNKTTFWQVQVSSCLGMALLKSSVALSLVRLSPGRGYIWCLRLTIGESFVAIFRKQKRRLIF